jgi:tetratricopeptide (TPR) repeat protein
MPQRLRVFISSPGDVPDERLRADLVVDKVAQDFGRFFSFETYRWEHEPMLASGHFQDAIDPPSKADVVILILWSRLGTPLPERTGAREYRGIDGRTPVTGTEWEYEDALQAARNSGAPDILAFRNVSPASIETNDPAVRKKSLDQLDALDTFWKRHFADRGVFLAAYDEYRTLEEFARRLEESLRKLIERRVAALAGAPAQAPIWPGAPFRGLEAYEYEHAAIFFGRDGLVAKAAEQLAAGARAGTAFVLVTGPSGSGKSSLVKAALVPRLMKRQRIQGVAFLRRAVFRPSDGGGGDVVLGLVEALTRSAADGVGLPEMLAPGQDAAMFAAHLRAAVDAPGFVFAGALSHLTRAGRDDGRLLPFEEAKLILVIDQLEELFTTSAIGAADRHLFIRLIGNLARSGTVWVVATLRADFWHRAAEIPELVALTQATGRLDIAPASPAELAEIIRKPAQAAGLGFETHAETGLGLDAVLAEHAASEPGVLPLLSFTLDALYGKDIVANGGRLLTFATYQALGGLEGAIATRADEIVAALPAPAQAAVPRVIRALATISSTTDQTTVARAAPLRNFPEGGATRQVVDALTAARLLVASDENATASVRLAHEALISHWQRARAQLVADGRDLQTRALIERLQARWAPAAGRAKQQLLLRDPDLANAIDLDTRWGDELDAPTRNYIQISRTRARLRQRLTVAAAAVFALVAALAVAGAIYAEHESRLAEKNLNTAILTADSLVTDIAGGLRPLAGVSAEIVRAILKIAEADFDTLSKSAPDSALLQWDRAKMQLSFADTSLSLGDDAEALRRARGAQAIMDGLIKQQAESAPPGMLVTQAEAHRWAGDVFRFRGDLDNALLEFRDSLDIRERTVAKHPEMMAILGIGHGRLGYLLADQGDSAAALTEFRAALAIREKLAADGRKDRGMMRDIAVGHRDSGNMLVRLGDGDEALAEYRTALALDNDLATAVRGNDMTLQWDIAALHGYIGNVLFAQHSAGDALTEFRLAADTMKPVTLSDPSNVQKQTAFEIFHIEMGDALRMQGNVTDADAQYDLILQTMRELAAKGRPWSGAVLVDLARSFILCRDFTRALETSDFAIAHTSEASSSYVNRAAALMFLGRTDEAREVYLKHRAEKMRNGQSWESAVVADFALFRGAGLADPLMDEIEKRFAS